MSQFGRILPLTASAALMVCASVGCNGPQNKQDEPLEPPVMAQEGAPSALAKPMPAEASADEVELVESAGRLREQYGRALESLLALYRRYGYFEKANWAEREIEELAAIAQYPYLGDRRAPSTRYEATQSIAEADALYAQARKLHEDAGGLGNLLGVGKGKLKAALDTYRRLIDQHPTSDKIDDAAYYAGEICASDTYKEYTLALNFFQRCLDWNPNTDYPVKFRMAFVYDYPLGDREKALALYKEVVASSPNRANVRFARERIAQITERTSHEAPDAEPGRPR